MLQVDVNAAGQRLDNFLLKHLKGVPHSYVYRIIRSGEVRVNKKRAQASSRLIEGDIVRVPPTRTATPVSSAASQVMHRKGMPPLSIIFEDDHLMAVNKPAGLAVHGGSGINLGLIEQMRLDRPELKFLELVHRLDRETSGVLLLAKRRPALLALHAMLRDHQDFHKEYLLVVSGHWPKRQQHVTLPLYTYVNAQGERRVRVDEHQGKPSQTQFQLLSAGTITVGEVNHPCSLLRAQLLTGRTHQIRVHTEVTQHPIMGDDKYGDFTLNRALAKQTRLNRMFLHAWRVCFMHPVLQTELVLSVPLPSELIDFVQQTTLVVDASMLSV